MVGPFDVYAVTFGQTTTAMAVKFQGGRQIPANSGIQDGTKERVKASTRSRFRKVYAELDALHNEYRTTGLDRQPGWEEIAAALGFVRRQLEAEERRLNSLR